MLKEMILPVIVSEMTRNLPQLVYRIQLPVVEISYRDRVNCKPKSSRRNTSSVARGTRKTITRNDPLDLNFCNLGGQSTNS